MTSWYVQQVHKSKLARYDIEQLQANSLLNNKVTSHRFPVNTYIIVQPLVIANFLVYLSAAAELHVVYECPALQPLRQQYAPLFSTYFDSF